MPHPYNDTFIEIEPSTGDSRVDDLAKELVRLTPDWVAANPDYERSVEILKEIDKMGPSAWQKKQVVSYVQSQWTTAASQARQLGLFQGVTRTHYQAPLSQILGGICLVQSRTHTPA